MKSIYYVALDAGDVVGRKFLDKNEDLKTPLENLPIDKRQRYINMNIP